MYPGRDEILYIQVQIFNGSFHQFELIVGIEDDKVGTKRQ